MTISDNEWYRVTTAINSTGFQVSINGEEVAFVTTAFWGTGVATDGTWAFGPYLDQEAYCKDVEAIAQNGTVVYTNAMTSDEVYQEYALLPTARQCVWTAQRETV
jgi:hypothetical protein